MAVTPMVRSRTAFCSAGSAARSGAGSGEVGKTSTPPPASTPRARRTKRRRKARPAAALAGSIARAAAKRSATPGPKRGFARAIQPPSVAHASCAWTQRKCS